MSLTATLTEFLLLLLSVEVIWGQDLMDVKCNSTKDCAVTGSFVELQCSFRYQPTRNNFTNKIKEMDWFIKRTNEEPVKLSSDPQYADRMLITDAPGNSILLITDLRENDTGVYFLRVETNQPGGTYTSDLGVLLIVTDLQVEVYDNGMSPWPFLHCENFCRKSDYLSYIWYKNGEEIEDETSFLYYSEDYGSANNFSCALKGEEDFPSPPVLIPDQTLWEVNCHSTEVCGFKGSSVELSCSYRYPGTINGIPNSFKSMEWFTKNQNGKPVYLWEDQQFLHRVEVGAVPGHGYLEIRDLRETDSGMFYFRVETDQPGGIYTSDPGVSLSIKHVPDLQVQLIRNPYHDQLSLWCHSSCFLDRGSSIIWYKNGEDIQKETYFNPYKPHYMSLPSTLDAADSYSCALEGFKEFPSPFFCESASFCNRVSYTDRRICAPKGSSVNISCSFNSYSNITSKFWFSPKYSHHWKYSIPPEDLSEDYHQSDRIQVFETEKGHSTLRITNLGESDSAEYHFKFKTQSFEWNSSLPATTLTVTALQVQMIEKITNQSSTFVVLRCLSSCSPADHVSYTWFRNRETDLSWGETSVFKGWFPPEDEISCALKGHEQFPSPPVYAPKVLSVLRNSSGVTLENTSVTLTCSCDANPAANYTWFKKDGDPDLQPLSHEAQLVLSSIQASDSGEYYCVAENGLGKRTSKLFIVDVKYKSTLIINVIRLTVMVVILIPVLLFSLWMRKKTTFSPTEPKEPEETLETAVLQNPEEQQIPL